MRYGELTVCTKVQYELFVLSYRHPLIDVLVKLPRKAALLFIEQQIMLLYKIRYGEVLKIVWGYFFLFFNENISTPH